jgi:CBS domain-containing protein
MLVRDGMSRVVLTVGPEHTLRAAAALMAGRRVGAAVVIDPDSPGPGILTELDLLESIVAGQDPDTERVCDHLTSNIVFAAPDWSLEEAAAAMVKGAFRHLIVTDRGEIAGILSVRDIVRVWTDDGSICDVPESAKFGAVASRGARLLRDLAPRCPGGPSNRAGRELHAIVHFAPRPAPGRGGPQMAAAARTTPALTRRNDPSAGAVGGLGAYCTNSVHLAPRSAPGRGESPATAPGDTCLTRRTPLRRRVGR